MGTRVGVLEGCDEGQADGTRLGMLDGADVGCLVGIHVGTLLGEADGTAVGRFVGTQVGTVLGTLDGVDVGIKEGTTVGELDGACEAFFFVKCAHSMARSMAVLALHRGTRGAPRMEQFSLPELWEARPRPQEPGAERALHKDYEI